MLEAVTQKKLRGHLKDLVRKDYEASRFLQEDVITSAVFGPLRYMQAADAWAVIRGLIGHHSDSSVVEFKPTKHELIFWPMLRLGTRRVEPDLVCKFMDDAECCHVVVIEVKWNAPLGEDQLHLQELAARLEYPTATRHHILLAKTNATEATQIQLESTSFNGAYWHQIAANGGGGAAKIWSAEIPKFLAQLGVSRFESFLSSDQSIDIDAVKLVEKWRTSYWTFAGGISNKPIGSSAKKAILTWRISE